MALDPNALAGDLLAVLQKTGYATASLHHEPKSAPAIGDAITMAFWCTGIHPVQSSGLNSVSVRLEYTIRIYSSALKEPADGIDPELLTVIGAVFQLLAGDVDRGGLARYVDLYGADGDQLQATFGYLTQDSKIFRTADIRCPLVLNDVWVIG